MLLQDIKDIKNGRIVSGQKELTLDSKTKDDREPDQSDIEAAQRGNNMVGMSVADLNDLVRLMEGKPTFAAKVTVIAAKQMIAAKKRMGAGDSKSTKDQIAELEEQKEQARKQGYGTDAYDAQIKALQKDEVLVENYKGIKIYSEQNPSLGGKFYWVHPKTGQNIHWPTLMDVKEDIDKHKELGYLDSKDEGDTFTQDPLTEKGKEILANMKEQYGDEEGEKIFYASKNKGTISGVDSKTKDGLEEEIKKMAREKADRPFNDDGTIRTPQQAQLAYEQWYKIIKSRYKNDSRFKDSDIIINVVENPNEEVEPEEEAFDLIHYNGYNIKLVKETGEFDIYDVGGAMIGHTATLELAKLFVDNKGNAIIG